MNNRPIPSFRENAALPSDLAERWGAVRLTHLALEAVQAVEAPRTEFRVDAGFPGHSFRMLLTLLTYAYARGALSSEEIQERVRSELDFRYLATSEFPDATALRSFRRREWSRLHSTLSHLVRAALGVDGCQAWLAADQEAARRLEAAVAADSLALDC